ALLRVGHELVERPVLAHDRLREDQGVRPVGRHQPPAAPQQIGLEVGHADRVQPGVNPAPEVVALLDEAPVIPGHGTAPWLNCCRKACTACTENTWAHGIATRTLEVAATGAVGLRTASCRDRPPGPGRPRAPGSASCRPPA